MIVASHVIEKILGGLPCEPPESGGILGGSGGVVTCSVLDVGKAGGPPCSYTPNTTFLNRQIQEWFRDGIEFMGIFHVHFGGAESLSTGDIAYIEQIMNVMPEQITCLYFPIILMPEREIVVHRVSKDDGKIKIEREQIFIKGGLYNEES